MMMIVRSRSRDGSVQSRLLTVAAIAAVIIAGGYFAGPFVRDLVVSTFYASDSAARYALLPRSMLIERLVRAEDTVERTRYQSVLYDAVYAELATLRAELALGYPESYLAARVAAAPPRTHYDTLLIAAGADDGVLLGDIATTHGVAVGRVTDVSKETSIVALYSTPGAEHDTYVGEPRAIVVARGLGGGSLETTVPDSVTVVPGAVVLEAASGFPYAVVTSVVKREIDTSAIVRMSIVASPATLTVVSLVHSTAL